MRALFSFRSLLPCSRTMTHKIQTVRFHNLPPSYFALQILTFTCMPENSIWIPISVLECTHAVSPALDIYCTSEVGIRDLFSPLPWNSVRHTFICTRSAVFAEAVYIIRCVAAAYAIRPEFSSLSLPRNLWQHILTFTHESFFDPGCCGG